MNSNIPNILQTMCIVKGIGHVRTFCVCTLILPATLNVENVVGQNLMCPPVKTEVVEVVVVMHFEVVEVRDLVIVEVVVVDFEAAGIGGLDFEAKIVVDLEVEAVMDLEVEAAVKIKALDGLFKATDLEEVPLKNVLSLITIIIITKCSNCQKTFLSKQPKPNIYFKPKTRGSLHFNSTCALTCVDEKLVRTILHKCKLFNAEVLFCDDCTAVQFIFVIIGNRVYLNCLYVYNMINQVSLEELDQLTNLPYSLVISSYMKLNLDYLCDALWEHLNLVRIYKKQPGCSPDFEDTIILKRGSDVKKVCFTLHPDLPDQFKYALVLGNSTKFNPQRVGLAHEVADEDVIQIVKK